jgi:Tfp pilus assembly protein PilF
MNVIGVILAVCLAFPAIAETKADAQAFLQQGHSSLKSGDLKAAREKFNKAFAADPKSALAAMGLGQVAALEGRTADAISNFRLCVKLDAKAKECQSSLAKLEAGAKKS